MSPNGMSREIAGRLEAELFRGKNGVDDDMELEGTTAAESSAAAGSC